MFLDAHSFAHSFNQPLNAPVSKKYRNNYTGVKKRTWTTEKLPIDSESDVSDEEVYPVERLLKKRTKNNKLQYLVKWKNCEEESWEPKENLVRGYDVMIQEFEKTKSTKRARKTPVEKLYSNIPFHVPRWPRERAYDLEESESDEEFHCWAESDEESE